MRACLGCYKEAENLKRCGSCHVAHFCNEQCQRKAWPNHRLTCKKLADSNAQHAKFDLVVGPGTAQKLNHACTLYRFANLQKFNPEIAAKEHVFIECEPESPIGRFLTSTQNTDRREQCKPLYLDKSTIYIFSMDFIKVLDYSFYRHLREALADNEQEMVDRKTAPGLITDSDGDLSIHDLERLLSGDACVQASPKGEAAFFETLNSAIDAAVEEAKKAASKPTVFGPGVAVGGAAGLLMSYLVDREQGSMIGGYKKPKSCADGFSTLAGRFGLAFPVTAFPAFLGYLADRHRRTQTGPQKDFTRKMDEGAVKFLGAKPGKGKNLGNYCQTKNPVLKECLSKTLAPKMYAWSNSYVLHLLARGIPFICEGKYDEASRRIQQGPVDHAAVVVGYKVDTSAPNNAWFAVQNSWGTPVEYWGIESCGRIVVLSTSTDKQ